MRDKSDIFILGSAAMFALAIILAIAIPIMLNPLRRPISSVRKYVLSHTPIGMSMDEVKTVIEEQKWGIAFESTEQGYSNSRLPPGQRIIGEKHIYSYMGTSRVALIVPVLVSVYWGFDEDGKLIDVYVVKILSA